MDESVFHQELSMIAKNFGVRGKIFEDKTELLWQEFNKVPSETWKRACRAIIENDDKFPNIKRFKTILAEVARYLQYKGSDVPAVPCDRCDGAGLLTAYKLNGEEKILGEYCFRCNCENAAYQSTNIPKWEEKHIKDNFVLKDMYDDSHAGAEFEERISGLREKAEKSGLSNLIGAIGKSF